MTPYVTLLERLGHDYYEVETGIWAERCYGLMDNPNILIGDKLKAFALEVGAKEAAEWFNEQLKKTKWAEALHEIPDGCWMCQTTGGGIAGPLLTNLELIQEATQAGWEIGEGLFE